MTVRIPRPRWQLQAACRDTVGQQHVKAFFPERYGSGLAGKQMCARCPVVDDCLAMALADDTLDGIWGGTSAPERDRLRARKSA